MGEAKKADKSADTSRVTERLVHTRNGSHPLQNSSARQSIQSSVHLRRASGEGTQDTPADPQQADEGPGSPHARKVQAMQDLLLILVELDLQDFLQLLKQR